MQRWEYKFVKVDVPSGREYKHQHDESPANRLGDQGWELVATYPVPIDGYTNHVWLLYKRQKYPPQVTLAILPDRRYQEAPIACILMPGWFISP
jgi:hypothetical protein